MSLWGYAKGAEKKRIKRGNFREKGKIYGKGATGKSEPVFTE
jgi:hypothetical protein